MKPHAAFRVPLWAALFLLAALLLAAAPSRPDVPPVQVVIFTHVEDNTPGGLLGSPQCGQSYRTHRSRLISMAALAESLGVQWTLQPDWKLLEAALIYEDSALRATTNGKNLLRHLAEDRGAVIDPHSHESGGYNYTDVAHLLELLGVGATTVIGGHVWDPALPQFQEWDRFRVPVAGQHYPGALWRGDILIGSGTPNHVNDPVVSGVWRPRDRDHYFEHDSLANITAIGQWRRSVSSIQELIALYREGVVPPSAMLTFSCNINPMAIGAPGGLAAIADTVFAPIIAWRDSGLVVDTDFTTLVRTWETEFGAVGYLYDANLPVTGVPDASLPGAGLSLAIAAPNPARAATVLRFSLARETAIRLSILDLQGREVATLASGAHPAGNHAVWWDAQGVRAGVYVCRLQERGASVTTKLVVMR